jgi:hypothetical protein
MILGNVLYLDYQPSSKGHTCRIGRTIDGRFETLAAHRVNSWFGASNYLRVQGARQILEANPDRIFSLAGQTLGEKYHDHALPKIRTLVADHNERALGREFAEVLSSQKSA